jgi:hypothetical protein
MANSSCSALMSGSDVLLAVNKDRFDGWRATVVTALQPTNRKQYQASVDQIVAELRKEYGLAE